MLRPMLQVEVLRVIVRVGQPRIYGRMEGGNQPLASPNTRGDVSEREPVELCRRKAGTRRRRIDPAPVELSRLNQFDA